jgi:hypothetical protein
MPAVSRRSTYGDHFHPPDEWPDGIVPFESRYPHARLDVFRFNTLDNWPVIRRRVDQGEVTRYADAQFTGLWPTASRAVYLR